MGRFGLFLAVSVVLVAMFFGIGHESQYVFKPEEMQRIAREAIAEGQGSDDAIVSLVVKKLSDTYPGYVVPQPRWIFNNAGGAMGSMLVLHCSLSEYVIIFGTAVGTEGHTGRFLADDYFTILVGEQWAHTLGKLDKEVYAPGDQHHLSYGTAKQYKMPEKCWALEYARGNIPSMLPFGIWDAMFSTVDLVSLWWTVWESLQNMAQNVFVMHKI